MSDVKKELYTLFYGMLKAHSEYGNQLPGIQYALNTTLYPESVEDYSVWYKNFMRKLNEHIQQYGTSHHLEAYLEKLVLLPHYSFDDYIKIFLSYGFKLNKSTTDQLRFVKYYHENLVATIMFEPYNRKLSVITNGNSISDHQDLVKDLDSLSNQYYINERTLNNENSSSK
jgi:hypothetical protein